MPLTPLPDQGIEVPLSEYNRLRAFQGGGWFWDHDNQQVIREVLGDFLPRVEERRDRGGALFQHFVGGVEAASKSQAVGAQMNRVPKKEFNRLQRALENLKGKAQDPHTDPNARRIIEKFCLPDPTKDPDLYRMYGSSWNRRLLVLWGCEREEGTSLAPAAALNKIAVEPLGATFLRRLPLLSGLLLLLLLLVFAAGWWWHQHEAQRRDPLAVAAASATVPPGAGNRADASTRTALEKSDVTPTTTAQDPGDPRQAGSVKEGKSNASGLSALDSHPLPLTASASPGATTEQSFSDAAKPSSTLAPPAETPGDAREKSTSATGVNPSLKARDHAVTPSPDESKKGSSTTMTKETDAASDSQRNAISPPSKNETTAPPKKSTSPTPAGALADTVNGATDADTGSAAAAPGGSPTVAVPRTPPKLEILKAQSTSTPHDGKMDTILMATAHDGDGSLTPVDITRWSVDGNPQRDHAGHDTTTGQINLSLTPGVHRVNVVGTAHGVAVESETEVNVQIKSAGDVSLKPKAAK